MSLTHIPYLPQQPVDDDSPGNALGKKLVGEFDEAQRHKKLVEPRLLKCLRQYKGVYDPDVLKKIDKERSDVFIRHTAAKVEATKARLMDLLFPSNGALNWEIKPSPRPTVAPEAVQAYVAERQLKQQPIPSDIDQLERDVAARAAELMSARIADQLSEPSGDKAYNRVCDRVMRNGLVYGTGVLKGPLVSIKDQKRFTRTPDGRWIRQSVQPGDEYKPFFTSVSVWSIYPDPVATEPGELVYIWEEHIMNRADFLALEGNPGFRGDIIRAYIAANPNGDAKISERMQEVRAISRETTETGSSVGDMKGRYRLLERWGYLNGEDLLAAGLSEEDIVAAYPKGMDATGSYPACMWMTGDGRVVKAALAPVEGIAIPYGFFQPYKEESGFWADGLCDRIRDPQRAINAMARMTLDHASITTLPQICVNVSALSAGENPTEFYAGKVWPFADGEDMARCMRVMEINSHIPEIMAIGEKFSQWSDETSTPRYMTGDNAGVRGAGDTASGLSMLMGAASLPSKDMVRQFDALTETFITNVYNWNMRFCPDERVKGDFDIIARGSSALIAQELQGRRMLEVMALLNSPTMADKVDFDFVLRHILHYMSLPDGVRMTDEQIQIRKAEDAKRRAEAMLSAIMEQAQKQGVPPQVVLQQAAGMAMQGLQQAGGPPPAPPAGSPGMPVLAPGMPQGGPPRPGPGGAPTAVPHITQAPMEALR